MFADTAVLSDKQSKANSPLPLETVELSMKPDSAEGNVDDVGRFMSCSGADSAKKWVEYYCILYADAVKSCL